MAPAPWSVTQLNWQPCSRRTKRAGVGTVGVGSLKTNIGHLDTAAGVASMMKVAQAMRRELLPASLNFSKPNSRFDFPHIALSRS
jgi:acyl transferase domain-containing protein